MTKEKFDEKYVNEDTYVLCKDEKLAKKFLKLAEKFGYKWLDGDSYSYSNMWFVYKEDTCYNLYKGEFNSLEDCMENCLKIIEFK